jgi:hypothetical protein
LMNCPTRRWSVGTELEARACRRGSARRDTSSFCQKTNALLDQTLHMDKSGILSELVFFTT